MQPFMGEVRGMDLICRVFAMICKRDAVPTLLCDSIAAIITQYSGQLSYKMSIYV